MKIAISASTDKTEALIDDRFSHHFLFCLVYKEPKQIEFIEMFNH